MTQEINTVSNTSPTKELKNINNNSDDRIDEAILEAEDEVEKGTKPISLELAKRELNEKHNI